MHYQDHITIDFQVQLGKPVIKGTRLTVELMLRKLAQGASVMDLLRMYPHLKEADVQAALLYAAEALASEEIIEPAK